MTPRRRLDTLAATVARTAADALPRVHLIMHEDPEESAEKDGEARRLLAEVEAGRAILAGRIWVVRSNREPIIGETPEETAARLAAGCDFPSKPRP